MTFASRLIALAACALVLPGFTSSDIVYKSMAIVAGADGADIRASLTKPDGGGPFPAVVMLPPCAGLNVAMRQDWAQYLAGQGYVSLSADSIGSRDMKNCLSHGIPGRRQLFSSWIGDAFGALDHLARLPYVDRDRIAVIGFSNGGIVLGEYIARDLATPAGLRFKAAISVYTHCNGSQRPGGDPVSGTPRIPWMVLNGALERDEMNGPCSMLKGRSNFTMHLVENAHHGFDIRSFTTPRDDGAGNIMLYSEDATNKAREIVRTFLARHVGR